MGNKSVIYQTGTISSLISGVYEGDCTIGALHEFGDFGLGTPDLVSGEVIIDQGVAYCADEHGCVRVMDKGDVTPFAAVVKFKPQHVFKLNAPTSFSALEATLDECLPTLNAIYAMRITGHFDAIKARSECMQERPFKPLHQTLPQKQRIFEWHHVAGTMVALRFPAYLSGVNVAGYHLHFIDDNKTRGGHVFAFATESELDVAVCKLDRLVIDAIDNACFNATEISAFGEGWVDKIEKIRT